MKIVLKNALPFDTKSKKASYLVFPKTLCIPQGHCWPKILKAKHDRKDIKLLAAKKTTYIEKYTLYQSYLKLSRTIVYKRVTSDPKIISRTENTKKIGPTLVTIFLEQK